MAKPRKPGKTYWKHSRKGTANINQKAGPMALRKARRLRKALEEDAREEIDEVERAINEEAELEDDYEDDLDEPTIPELEDED